MKGQRHTTEKCRVDREEDSSSAEEAEIRKKTHVEVLRETGGGSLKLQHFITSEEWDSEHL